MCLIFYETYFFLNITYQNLSTSSVQDKYQMVMTLIHFIQLKFVSICFHHHYDMAVLVPRQHDAYHSGDHHEREWEDIITRAG